MKILRLMLVLCGAVLFYFVFYIIARTVLPVLPRLNLWEEADFLIEIVGLHLPFFDILFFTLGLLVFCHGALYLLYVMNHTVSLNLILRKKSVSRLSGPYAKVRHPVYTAFLMIELGLFFSLRNVYAVFFIIFLWVFQVFAVWIEEEYFLQKKYEDLFTDYTARVPRRLFTPTLLFYASCLGLLLAGGVYTLVAWA